MEKITVAELATECSVKNDVVLGELKRLGLYVFASTAPIDPSFADTIRKKILSQREAEESRKAEAERKKEEAARKAEKKAKPARRKKATAAAAEETPAPAKRAPKRARKAAPKAETPVEKPVEEAPRPKPSLTLRRGKKHYDRETGSLVDEVAKSAEAAEVPHAEPVVELPTPVESQASVAVTAPEQPVELEPWYIQPEEPKAPPVEPSPVPEPKLVEATPPEAAQAHEPVPKPPEAHPGRVSKKIVVAKSKAQILMRATAERSMTPETPERVHRVVAPDRIPSVRTLTLPGRPVRRKKPAKPETPEKVAKVVELPRPPASLEEYKPIQITEGVTIKELAEKMDIKSKFIISRLLDKGILAAVNQAIDVDIATEICAGFGFRAEVISFEQEAEASQQVADNPDDYRLRPPVVTVMGHVDHGKTSLLDAIRETKVAASEAGGITQHIGAYQVEVKDRSIVFLDTPGHEAFTLMRARGAHATDIVVLVVAADDGVMPQTIEAIHHAKAANVPIVVAINKIDKPGAVIDRVKQSLADQGLLSEDWGGEVVTVPVSAKLRTNLDLLLEMILLVADMRELRANPKRLASGVVLEAKIDKGRGCVATVLVQNGTLQVGDVFLAGAVHGRVRALVNDRGRSAPEAGPSIPVEILGLQDVPQAGDTFQVFEDAMKAKQVAEIRQAKIREKALAATSRLSLQALYAQMTEGKVKELPLILKADVQGSVEVLSDVLNKLSTDKVKVRILHSAAGAVTESDVLLASASNAIIIGFNVRPDRKAQETADNEGVEIRLYTVIYNVANEIKSAMIGMLDVTRQERYVGRAEVRDTFRVPKFGVVAGSYIQDGIIRKNSEVRLLRDNVVIHEGKVGSLRRFKEDVTEVKSGFECGIGLERYQDIKIGDIIEAYVIEKIQPTAL